MRQASGTAGAAGQARRSARWHPTLDPARGLALPIASAPWAADLAAVLGLVALGIALDWRLFTGRVTVGLDSLTQFFPWYAFLGERLRAGELPGWNPHTAAGAPFAADPLSGWTYLPAMVLFTLLPLPTAAAAYLLLHPILAATGAYLLGRALGLTISGALVAGVAYGQTGFLAFHNTCCFAFASVAAWLPFVLLGAELAARAGSWQSRVRWWGLSGVALSQIFAAWPGQGTYYALLVVAAFVAFRNVAAPRASRVCRADGGGADGRDTAGGGMQAGDAPGVGTEVYCAALMGWATRLLFHGGAPVLIAAGLAAAGLLPRLEYNALSSLAGGYAPEELYVGGWGVLEWWQLIWPSAWYAGGLTMALAVMAPRLAPGWPWTRYFSVLSICLLALTGHGLTPLHWLVAGLPGFGRLHPHLPERIATVFYLGAALLAGATAMRIGARLGRGRLLTAIVLLVIVADGRTGFEATVRSHAELRNVDTLVTVDIADAYAPTPAARFLRERRATDGPFRFLGYAPEVDGLAYTQRFADPEIASLGVNNRAITDGLDDVQGYNAIHLARYDAYLRALNDRAQNYHNADIFELGLRSPLLDVLNARYVVTPVVMPPGLADPRELGLRLTTAYEDSVVRMLERPGALPRAWVVHEARQVATGEGLDVLASGDVDPRRTVLLEVAPPSLATPTEGAIEAATVARHTPDLVEIDVVAAGDGLLVVSEAYYPAWRAWVDGAPAPVLVANHALRAVPVPSGEHRVTFRFESATLQLGMAVSVATALGLLGLAVVPIRSMRRPATPHQGAGMDGCPSNGDKWHEHRVSLGLREDACDRRSRDGSRVCDRRAGRARRRRARGS